MLKSVKLILILTIFLIATFLVAPFYVFSQSSGNKSAIQAEIEELNAQIKTKQSSIEEIQAKQKKYKEQIAQKQGEQASLKNQITILNGNISKTELEIRSTQIDIDKTNLEIKKVTLEIQEKEADITKKKEYLESLLRLIAKYDDKSTLEVLLVNNSLSEFLDQVQYIKDLNGNLKNVLGKVKIVKQELEEENEGLEKKKKELEELRKKLQEIKAEINDQKVNKQYILDKTRQSESEYQKLLAKAKAEQNAANAAIVEAERSIRRKLAEQQGKDKLKFNDNGFIWPVPKNVITAYFHDPDYPYRHIFEHPGADIRAGQGTPLRAAASGYVAKAKNNGYGYSYIMIVHGDGLSTVYGHVSRINVKVDDFVAQGQIIGASGGMPGTKGAGYLTTGPHLHFETRLNGIPVNPLNYLP